MEVLDADDAWLEAVFVVADKIDPVFDAVDELDPVFDAADELDPLFDAVDGLWLATVELWLLAEKGELSEKDPVLETVLGDTTEL